MVFLDSLLMTLFIPVIQTYSNDIRGTDPIHRSVFVCDLIRI